MWIAKVPDGRQNVRVSILGGGFESSLNNYEIPKPRLPEFIDLLIRAIDQGAELSYRDLKILDAWMSDMKEEVLDHVA